jgi:hypothetical protein
MSLAENYVSAWSEDERIGSRRVRAFVVILRTAGCRWYRESGCTMCGYASEAVSADADQIIRQFERAMHRYDGEEMIKIYTSGSFLDPEEVPVRARTEILRMASAAGHVLIETRPEFVVHLSDAIDLVPSIEVAIGLETADDAIRQTCVNKGFSFDQYVRAAEACRSLGASVRTYLLLKPPFLTERMAVNDVVESMRRAAPFTDTFSINPVNVQRNTLVEELFRRHLYAPPWIWSLVEVLRLSRDIECRVISHPSGGGTRRGVHNCGSCDAALLEGIRRFSVDPDLRHLEVDCECRRLWMAQMEYEGFIHSAGVDFRSEIRWSPVW